jgi:hypothetical protein
MASNILSGRFHSPTIASIFIYIPLTIPVFIGALHRFLAHDYS